VLGGARAVASAVVTELQALTPGSVERWEGPDRYATAAMVSRQVFEPGVAAVYVSTGEGFADALAGGAAGAAAGLPVLLVARDTIPEATAVELERLAPRRIVVLGGEQAVSGEVLARLAQFAPELARHSGADRYETAAAISRSAFAAGVPVVFLATGADFPDALGAVPAAARSRAPVLLVERDRIPESTRAELRRLGAPRLIVLGSHGAVSPQVLDDARALVP
jgi:putative cell wall-binding protein